MSGTDPKNGAMLCLEIGQGSLRILKGESGLELLLERSENGRLTEPCKEQVTSALREFLKRSAWQPRIRALCAINARGISLRQMSLPVATGEELKRLVRMQIESEFPVTPEQLAWGYRQVDGKENPTGRQTLLMAAVKKEVLEQYVELLSACGLNPVFTLAALARGFLCSSLQAAYAMLDVGRSQAELTIFENNAAVSVRVLQWEAENFSEQVIGGQFLDSLTTALRNNRGGRKLYLTGEGVRDNLPAQRLAEALSAVADCERIETPSGDGRSAAIFGLRKAAERDGGASLLTLQIKEAAAARGKLQPEVAKWAIRAAVLLALVIAFPFLEAMVMKARLAHKIGELENARGRLVMIDREFLFLQYLKSNQPPYLEAVYLMANSAAQGTRFDSITMNRRGEVSLKGTMQNSQQVGDFRTKLISSGFYSNVVVEEQTPAPQPGQQKVTVRMSALWKAEPVREELVLGPPREDFEKLRTAAKEARFVQSMPMGGSFPMPSFFPPPMGVPSSPSSSGRPMVRSPNAGSRRINLPPGVTLPPGFTLPEDNK